MIQFGPLVTEELIDICREDGAPTGRRKIKSAVHRDGDWHRAVHIWIVAPDQQLLLQKRATVKENYPGLWDISVAGHLSSGESAHQAALREGLEEIGVDLSADQFEYLTTVAEPVTLNGGTYIDREIHEIYVVRRAVDVAGLVLQRDEVDEARLVSFQDFEKMVAAGDASLVPHPREYEALLEYLRRR
jgi:isopentenyldiphosphate isomerase